MPRRTILDTERPPWARSIRARRLAARLSQGALGQRIGLSQATVADWETGRSQPRDAETILRLADALGATPADISPHSFSRPGAALPANPFQADELDQLFGSLFAALFESLQAAQPAVPAAVVAQWARRIWRLAGGTEHEARTPRRRGGSWLTRCAFSSAPPQGRAGPGGVPNGGTDARIIAFNHMPIISTAGIG